MSNLAQPLPLTLACTCALQEVDLSRTRMGPDACVVLAEALRVNTVVERILLHGNPLGESGGWHLMSAITHNRCLEYIGLQGANFRPSGEAPGEALAATQLGSVEHACLHLGLQEREFRPSGEASASTGWHSAKGRMCRE